jgi:hypothetical protein
MESQSVLNTPRVAGALLALSFFVFLPGGLLFAGRNGMAGNLAPSFAYFAWERGFVAAAAAATALGFVALSTVLGEAQRDALFPARLAAAVYAVATGCLLVGEAMRLRGGQAPYALIVAYVVLAFLIQAAFGVILVRSGLLPVWIGWAALVWNVAWLVVLPIVAPQDIYFPVVHHFVPLLVGVPLLFLPRS